MEKHFTTTAKLCVNRERWEGGVLLYEDRTVNIFEMTGPSWFLPDVIVPANGQWFIGFVKCLTPSFLIV